MLPPERGNIIELKNVPNEEKPKMGQLINETKAFISTLIDTKIKKLQEEELEAKLNAESIDITLPGVNFKSASKHPMNIVVDEIINIFLPLGYTVVDGPEVETDKFNEMQKDFNNIIESFIKDGIERTMNIYNTKK
jgi:phenylalanyl-tRNA synthetase alpha chain